jgi:hypothetical protein
MVLQLSQLNSKRVRHQGEPWWSWIIFLIFLIQSKNFCKCHNVPPPSTTIKRRNKAGNVCVWERGRGKKKKERDYRAQELRIFRTPFFDSLTGAVHTCLKFHFLQFYLSLINCGL